MKSLTVHYPGKSEPLKDRHGRDHRVWSSPRVFVVAPDHVPAVLKGEYRWMRQNGTPREVARWHVGRMLDMTYGRGLTSGRFASDLVPDPSQVRELAGDSGGWDMTDEDAYNAGYYGRLAGMLTDRMPGWAHLVLCGWDDADEGKDYGASLPEPEPYDDEE